MRKNFDKAYLFLFTAITDAVKLLKEDDAEAALTLLEKSQQDSEWAYITASENISFPSVETTDTCDEAF